MQRLVEIDIVKGIAMLTVLWHHSFILYPIYMLDIPWCQHARAINGTFFMNVFFLVSGYLFAFSKKRAKAEILKSKLMRLMVPFLSFSAVALGMKLIAPSLVNRKVESVGSYMESLLLGGGELWFVYVLFMLFLIWPWILRYSNIKLILVIVTVLLMADILIPRCMMNNVFLCKRVIHFSIFYVAGYAMKEVSRKWLDNSKLFLVFSLLFVLLCCIFVRSIHIPYVSGYINAFVGCGFIWMLSYRLKEMHVVGDTLSFVGKYSLPFYWLNGFVLVVARTIVVKGLHFGSSVAIVLSIFALCVVMETLAVKVLRKYPKVGWLIGF